MTGQGDGQKRILPNTKSDWLIARKQGIGGSDMAAIMGLSRFRTALDVYYDKTTNDTDDKDNVVFRRGRALEPLIVELFREAHGYEVIHNTGNELLVHNEIPYLFGTNDGTIIRPDGTQGTLECKSAAGLGSAKWQQGVPKEYIIQTQHYMSIYGHEWGYIAWLVDDIYGDLEIEIDYDLIAAMQYMAKDFWENHVIPQIPPDASTLNDYKKLANKMTVAGVISATENMIDLFIEYDAVKDMINDTDSYKKSLQERKNELEFLIRKYIAHNEIVMLGEDELATCKLTKAGYRKLWFNTKLINILKSNGELS